MTIRNTRNMHIRSSRVPLAEVYFSMSEALRTAWADEIESSSIEMTPAPCGLEVCGVTDRPGPGNSEGRPVFKRDDSDSRCAVWRQYPQPEATDGVLTIPLKGSGYSSRLVYTPRYR